jgi:hypothetical protein
VSATVKVGDDPIAVAADGHAVWVANRVSGTVGADRSLLAVTAVLAASIEWTKVGSLRPDGPRRPLAQVDQRIGALLDPSRSARVAGSRPVLATAWVSSKPMSSWSRVWGGVHRERAVPFGTTAALASAILPSQRAFLMLRVSMVPVPQRWIPA